MRASSAIVVSRRSASGCPWLVFALVAAGLASVSGSCLAAASAKDGTAATPPAKTERFQQPKVPQQDWTSPLDFRAIQRIPSFVDPFGDRMEILLTAYDPFDKVAWAAPLEEADYGLSDTLEDLQPTKSISGGYDPFDELAWAAPLGEANYFPQRPQQAAKHVEVAAYDPFDEVAWVAPLAEEGYAPPSELKDLQSVPRVPAEDVAEEEVSIDGWTPKPLDKLTINITLPSGGDLPKDRPAPQNPGGLPCGVCGVSRGWPLLSYHWVASCFCHQPLYFEEINLERYGYGCCGCFQAGVSAAHFFATVPALPYCMAVDCPCECDYTLGHYRPGDCAPWRTHLLCPQPVGLTAEAWTVTGLILLIP